MAMLCGYKYQKSSIRGSFSHVSPLQPYFFQDQFLSLPPFHQHIPFVILSPSPADNLSTQPKCSSLSSPLSLSSLPSWLAVSPPQHGVFYMPGTWVTDALLSSRFQASSRWTAHRPERRHDQRGRRGRPLRHRKRLHGLCCQWPLRDSTMFAGWMMVCRGFYGGF